MAFTSSLRCGVQENCYYSFDSRVVIFSQVDTALRSQSQSLHDSFLVHLFNSFIRSPSHTMSSSTSGRNSRGNSSNPRPGQSPFPQSSALVVRPRQVSDANEAQTPYTSRYANNFNRTDARYSARSEAASSSYSQYSYYFGRRDPSPPPPRVPPLPRAAAPSPRQRAASPPPRQSPSPPPEEVPRREEPTPRPEAEQQQDGQNSSSYKERINISFDGPGVSWSWNVNGGGMDAGGVRFGGDSNQGRTFQGRAFQGSPFGFSAGPVNFGRSFSINLPFGL